MLDYKAVAEVAEILDGLEELASPKATLVSYDTRVDATEYLGLGEEGALCGQWGMLLRCENNDFLLKTYECGREWCPRCGKDMSFTHRRRIARLLPKLFSWGSVGYMLFEVPVVLRPYFLHIEAIKEARRYLTRLLVREFGAQLVSRWHWEGEGGLEEFEDQFDREPKFHPHLNVLLDYGFIGKKQIKRLRRLWSKWLYRYCGRQYYKTAPVHYKYSRAYGKRYHLAKYVTRPTLKHLTGYAGEFAKELFRFNNQSWAGPKFTPEQRARGEDRFSKWREGLTPSKKRATAEVVALESFNKGLCPICHTKLTAYSYWSQNKQTGKWHKVSAEKTEQFEAIREFGAGLYQVRPPPWLVYNEGEDEREAPY